MGMTDPTLQNQALAALGSSFRVPTLEEAQANAAQFPALPVAGGEASLLEQAAGVQGLPSGGVSPAFSMVPVPEQPVVRADQPTPVAPAAVPSPQQLSATDALRQRLAGGQAGGPAGALGARNPLASMRAEAERRAKEAEAAARGYEARGDESLARVRQAGEDIGKVREGTYADIAGIYDQSARDTQDFQRRSDEMQRDADTAMAGVQADQRTIQDFMAKNREPKDRRSFGNKITGALAVAFSGIADNAILAASINAGTPVQTNRMGQMIGMIQAGIDRDLAQQQQMLQNARTELLGKQTEFGQLREKLGDDRSALAAAKALKLEQAANQIDAIKARGLSAEQQPLAEQASSALRLERDNLLTQVSDQRMEKHYGDAQRLRMAEYQQQQAAAAARARANRPPTAKEALDLEHQALVNAGLREQLGANGLPAGLVPLGGGKPGKDAIKEGSDIVSAAEGLRAVIGQLQDAAKDGATISPTKRDQAALALGALKSQFNLVLGDKTAANEAQLKMLDDMIANPTEFNLSNSGEVLKSLDDLAVRTTRGKLRGYGLDYDPAPVVRRGAAAP